MRNIILGFLVITGILGLYIADRGMPDVDLAKINPFAPKKDILSLTGGTSTAPRDIRVIQGRISEWTIHNNASFCISPDGAIIPGTHTCITTVRNPKK